MGRATALGLARLGATVVLLCRDPRRGEEALQDLRSKTGNPNIELMCADLSLQREIRRFAGQFRQRYPRLNVLANIAGIVAFNRQLTQEGIELTLAVDYLSHFLLTHLLLDQLRAGAPFRIITVSGGPWILQRAQIRFDDLQLTKRYNGVRAAVQAALAKVLFTFELARRLQGTGVTANTFHPGLVRSKLTRNFPLPLRVLAELAQPFLKRECPVSVYLASSPEVEGVSGKFFVENRSVFFGAYEKDEQTARRLWEASERLTGLA